VLRVCRARNWRERIVTVWLWVRDHSLVFIVRRITAPPTSPVPKWHQMNSWTKVSGFALSHWLYWERRSASSLPHQPQCASAFYTVGAKCQPCREGWKWHWAISRSPLYFSPQSPAAWPSWRSCGGGARKRIIESCRHSDGQENREAAPRTETTVLTLARPPNHGIKRRWFGLSVQADKP